MTEMSGAFHVACKLFAAGTIKTHLATRVKTSWRKTDVKVAS